MRRLLRDIAEGRELGDVTTLRDPEVMEQLEEKVEERQADRRTGRGRNPAALIHRHPDLGGRSVPGARS